MTIAAVPPLPTTPLDEHEKDAPLRDDIRLLGRILGDTVREQEGEETFQNVERIRQASIRFHRDNETGARRELAAILDGLDHDQTLRDPARLQLFFASRQHRRRRAPHPPQPRPYRQALGAAPRLAAPRFCARQGGWRLADERCASFSTRALVSPVLTAHPTEVRRKSTLTHELKIAELIAERGRLAGDEAALAENEEQLRATVLLLWRTNLLRQKRLRVIDEVANGLSYYDYTFFDQLPRIHAAVEDELARQAPETGQARVSTFLRVGSWIGGDRDGNPFVTASVLSEAIRLQSARALQRYLDDLHELGGELSVSQTLMRVSPELMALADRSADTSAARSDEPYRRAISGIYARLARTANELDHVTALRQPIGPAPSPTNPSTNSPPTSRPSPSRWRPTTAAILARGRLRALRRAVDVFGFHLAPIDLRQNANVHERTVAELFAAAIPGVEYLLLNEDARIELLRKELRSPRPLVSPFVKYSEETEGELAILRNAAAIRRTYGPGAIRTSIISNAPTSPTCWSSRCC